MSARGLLLVTCLVLVACGRTQQEDTAAGVTTLTVWAHSGQAAERATLQQQLARFNAAQADIDARLTFIPERDYNAQVQAAAVAGDLPDILEFDGPFLYNYVWQGHLRPLDTLLPASLQAGLLRSLREQGRYRGHLYAVGTFDSGLGLYGRRSLLQQAGARIPDGPAAAWSLQEFNTLLANLAEQDPDGAVLDLKLNYPGEWLTFAFSPLLQSAGADLIERREFRRAQGTLDSPQAVIAMQAVQDWLQQGRVDPNLDDAAFTAGRVALSLAGHWEYRRYHETFGDDLVLVPLPDLGRGSRTGQGSWAWGITRHSDRPQAAARLLRFLLQDEEILAMCEANAAVPATRSAIARSPLYAPGGPLHLFVTQLQGGYALPRPRTAAYPVITQAFQQAFRDIRNGMAVHAALQRAARAIDRDIRDNDGYRDRDEGADASG